jgi:predicted RNA-binding Zn-ribbon protein involved in translation (DUF1610 family)
LLHEALEADAAPSSADAPGGNIQPAFVCPDCGAAMIIIGTLVRRQNIRASRQQRIAV